ncbi:hypothetical protein P3S68_009678 [Capsicum galapagoense]
MANMISFLTSLLIILAILTLKIHAVDYTVTNRAANTPGGVRSNIASKQWKLPLPQDFPAERKNVQKVSMFVDDMDGIACSSNNEIHVLAPGAYIQSFSGNVKRFITGVLYHESTHIWQWNGNIMNELPGD